VRLLDQFKKRVGMLSKSAGLVDRPFPTEKDDDDVEMTEGEGRLRTPQVSVFRESFHSTLS